MPLLEKRRVLIVEDQFIIAMSLGEMLAELGAEVVGPALTIDQAIELASTADLDVAVLDLWLGGIASYPVGEILAQRGLPFILTTGVGRGDEPASFLQAPRLVKPFSTRELHAALLLALRQGDG